VGDPGDERTDVLPVASDLAVRRIAAQLEDAVERGAGIVRPVGGYGYSGWIWETVRGRFRIKQGPKLLSVETSLPVGEEA
jgi:acyl-CoA reductase-like NAD-dependent aldehyde dehydrogenase